MGFRVNSNLYPGRAPADKILITCFLGGVRNRAVLGKSDEELVQSAVSELSILLGVKKEPEFVHILRHARAIPQYDLSHPEKMETIEKALGQLPGLFLSGNYLRGVSVWDCLSQGMALGKKLSGLW